MDQFFSLQIVKSKNSLFNNSSLFLKPALLHRAGECSQNKIKAAATADTSKIPSKCRLAIPVVRFDSRPHAAAVADGYFQRYSYFFLSQLLFSLCFSPSLSLDYCPISGQRSVISPRFAGSQKSIMQFSRSLFNNYLSLPLLANARYHE